MCLAIPARIEELKEDNLAIVCIEEFTPENAEAIEQGHEAQVTRLSISTMLLPEPPQVGDYVMVHAGFAINRMDKEEAEEIGIVTTDEPEPGRYNGKEQKNSRKPERLVKKLPFSCRKNITENDSAG